MRKISLITSQDHFLIVMQSDEINEEGVCLNEHPGTWPANTSIFCSQGAYKAHTKSDLGNWSSVQISNSPTFFTMTENKPGISVMTGVPTVFIVFIPKDVSVINTWKNSETSPLEFLGSEWEGWDIILDAARREEFVVMSEGVSDVKRDPDTLEIIENNILTVDASDLTWS